MSGLPSGWSEVALADLSHKIGSGSTPTGGKTAYKEAGVPLIRSMNIHFSGFTDKGLAYLDKNQAKKLEGVTVIPGDVLLNITGASIGRVTIAPARMNGARVNQHVAIIRLADGIAGEFVSRYLSSPQMQRIIGRENYGVTRQALTKTMIEEFRIPISPLPEQRRIVAKIDSLSAKSGRARDHLDQLPLLVEKYKQAILTAAFRGELTHGWRTGRNTSVSVEQLEALRSKAWKYLCTLVGEGLLRNSDIAFNIAERHLIEEAIRNSGTQHVREGPFKNVLMAQQLCAALSKQRHKIPLDLVELYLATRDARPDLYALICEIEVGLHRLVKRTLEAEYESRWCVKEFLNLRGKIAEAAERGRRCTA